MSGPLGRPALISAAVAAIAASGCGNPSATEPERASATVETLLDACAAQEPEAALAVLTPPARSAFLDAPSVLAGCTRLIDLRLEEESSAAAVVAFDDAVVPEARVDGGFGTATIRLRGEVADEVELESVSGDWLISAPRT